MASGPRTSDKKRSTSSGDADAPELEQKPSPTSGAPRSLEDESVPPALVEDEEQDEEDDEDELAFESDDDDEDLVVFTAREAAGALATGFASSGGSPGRPSRLRPCRPFSPAGVPASGWAASCEGAFRILRP